MDIIGAMDAKNWITSYALWVNICLENAVNPSTHFIHFAEHRTSRFNCHSFWATLGGWCSLGRFIHFIEREKSNPNVRGKNLSYCYSSIVLKSGPTFRWICQLNMSVRWSIQIEKIGSAHIYIHISYISYTYHMHMTLVVPSRQCLFTY